METKEIFRWIDFIINMAEPYQIDPNKQHKFWDAVATLCENPEADISGLIEGNLNANQEIVVFTDLRGTRWYGVEYFGHYNASSVKELIVGIVEEINMWHNISMDELKRLCLKANYMALLSLAQKQGQI